MMADDYIKRSDAITCIHEWLSDILGVGNAEWELTVLDKRLKAIPAADVVEAKRGHWECKSVNGTLANVCSFCKCSSGVLYDYGYCPNCGAAMT